MSHPESWLCSICMQVVRPKGNGQAFRNCTPADQTLERFREAVANNCFLCSKIWNLSGKHSQAWDSLVPERWNSFHYCVDREEYEGKLHQIRILIIFEDPTREQSEQATDIRFRLVPLIGSEYENSFAFSEVQETTGSSATLDLAYFWFRECASHHKKCKNLPISTEGWLPSRLLDVGSDEDTHWKLLISATDIKESTTPAYLTLSYQWGTDPQHALLLSSTMDQHRRGTKISDLPQTFRDLVLVARRFGIRYVWIDCFCIIQNCRDDWEAEAPMMRHVYANAACNIAASASSNPNGGLFRSRDVRDIQPGIISTTLTSELPEKFYIFDKTYWDRQLLGGSLHTRGWVFQERFLGPRQLYFAQNQILWECLEEHKCEGFPCGIPLHNSAKAIDRLLSVPENRKTPDQRQKKSHLGCTDNDMTFDAVDLWCDLVTGYSRCYFTKAEDKLYAFAGVAKLFQEVTGDRYLAGVWRSQILHLLNWTVFTPKSKHSARYRAPSWSWASVDGPVKLHKPAAGFEFLVSVVDVDVTTKREGDDAVNVIGGFIKLKGALIKASYIQGSTNGQLKVQLRDGDGCSFIVWPFPDTTEIRFEGSGTIHFLGLKRQEIYYMNPKQSAEEASVSLELIRTKQVTRRFRVIPQGFSSIMPQTRKRSAKNDPATKSKRAKTGKTPEEAIVISSPAAPKPRLTTPDLEFDYDREKLRDQRPTPGRVKRPRLSSFDIDDAFKEQFHIPKPEKPKGVSKNDDRWFATQALADPSYTFHDLHVCHKKGRNGSPTYDDAGFQLDWKKVDDWMKPRAYSKRRAVNGMNRALQEAERESTAMNKIFFKDGKGPEGMLGGEMDNYIKDHVSKDLGKPWHQIDKESLSEWEQKGFAKVDANTWWREPNAEERKRMLKMMGGASLRKDL
ncbi:Fc.00g025960.m01.CDS01 [Cosmosporella sp. VM-42]